MKIYKAIGFDGKTPAPDLKIEATEIVPVDIGKGEEARKFYDEQAKYIIEKLEESLPTGTLNAIKNMLLNNSR